MADNFQDVAKQFVQFYYQQFDSDREQLAALYRDTSMLTYESESMTGVVPIITKLKVKLSHALLTPQSGTKLAAAQKKRRKVYDDSDDLTRNYTSI